MTDLSLNDRGPSVNEIYVQVVTGLSYKTYYNLHKYLVKNDRV